MHGRNNILISLIKMAIRSLRGEHLSGNKGKGCIMLALRRTVATSAPLVGAYSGLPNDKRKIEK